MKEKPTSPLPYSTGTVPLGNLGTPLFEKIYTRYTRYTRYSLDMEWTMTVIKSNRSQSIPY